MEHYKVLNQSVKVAYQCAGYETSLYQDIQFHSNIIPRVELTLSISHQISSAVNSLERHRHYSTILGDTRHNAWSHKMYTLGIF